MEQTEQGVPIRRPGERSPLASRSQGARTNQAVKQALALVRSETCD